MKTNRKQIYTFFASVLLADQTTVIVSEITV